jgi:hypothetical protein
MPEPSRRTWPPSRPRPADDPDRPDWTAARNAARHIAESWGIEAAEQRRLAEEYRQHLLALRAELHSLQVSAGLPEHSCPVCDKAADVGRLET